MESKIRARKNLHVHMKPRIDIFYILCCILALYSSVSFAIEHQDKSWSNFDITGHLFNSKKFVFDLSPQARYNFTHHVYDETRFEGALGYNISKTVVIWLGERYILPHADDSTRESDIFEQITWNAITKKTITLSSRTRLEDRKATQFPQVAYRLREKLTLAFPKAFSSSAGPVFSDEIFLNLNRPEWINQNVFNQNRAFAGIRFSLNKEVTFDTGYLNQYQLSNSGSLDNNILYLSLNIKMKKE